MKLLKDLLESKYTYNGVDWDTKSEQEQLELVNKDGRDIQRITNPSEALQLAAIKQDVSAIYSIESPTEKAQMLAVSKFGYSIKYLYKIGIEPSEAVQLAAINQTAFSIEYILNPLPNVIKAALTSPGIIRADTFYNAEVERIFKDNIMLMKKWIRYGETMRDQL
jgi:hypothetical protein